MEGKGDRGRDNAANYAEERLLWIKTSFARRKSGTGKKRAVDQLSPRGKVHAPKRRTREKNEGTIYRGKEGKESHPLTSPEGRNVI